MDSLITLAERGKIPNWGVMLGIKAICVERIFAERSCSPEEERAELLAYAKKLRTMPIAITTEKANEQHYEVPAQFFKLTLGSHLKYSSALFAPGVSTLNEAEERMLALTCERAKLEDGMKILELGCGWGSLTLFMAARYPHAEIVALSNSQSQREYIEKTALNRGLKNIRIITDDINRFQLTERFDRVVSVEMFEHMRNYQLLLAKVRSMLKDDGKLFVHIFCHKKYAYEYETEGSTNWLGKYFFTGGQMPSDDLFFLFQDDLVIDEHWRISGTHYERTARAWRENLERNRAEITALFETTYGAGQGEIWTNRWKIFYMACEGLFGFRNGKEWWVSHYLMSPRRTH